jgi:predicted HTH transcriptional regulator
MNDEEFAILIDRGAELRHVEFKGPGAIGDKHFVHRIVRAILGMANRVDGGYVILGVNESGGVLNPVGIDPKTIDAWKRDALADKVAPLVDPSVDFDLEHRIYQSRKFVLIVVREFDETPVFCRRTINDANGTAVVLREGALYVRGRRKPETIEIRTSQEMRDLLDLALRKRLRHFVELAQVAGFSGAPTPALSDTQRFKSQAEDLGI